MGGNKVGQLLAEHRLGDEDRQVLAAVDDGDRVTDHFGGDDRGAGPCLLWIKRISGISGNESGSMRFGTRFRIIQMWKVHREKYRLHHLPQSLWNVVVLVRCVYGTGNVFDSFGEDGTGTKRLLISRERCSRY